MFFFAVLVGLVFLVLASIVFSLFLHTARIALHKFFSREPARKPGLCRSLVVSFVLVFSYAGIMVTRDLTRNGHFYEDRGFLDYWRTPLIEPYQITMIDDTARGSLGVMKDEDVTSIVGCVLAYAANERTVVGEVGPSWMFSDVEHKWFVFFFYTRTLTCYATKAEFLEACRRAGYSSEPQLRSVAKQNSRYWSEQSFFFDRDGPTLPR